MSNYYCLNCGSLVPAGEKFCPVCGDPVTGNDRLQTNNIKFPESAPEADTLGFVPVEEKKAAPAVQPQADAKTITVKKQPQKQESAPAPVKEKKPSLFSRIFFEEVEVDDDEYEEEKHHSHALPIILIILLAVLIGAFGFLYLEKPDLLNRGLNKIGLGLPGYSSSAAAATVEASTSAVPSEAAATATPAVSTSIGTLTVNIESINIRDTAATTGNALGQATQGTQYTVLASQTGEGYTWYEIGENQWIADSNGEWVTFTSSN